MYSIAIFSSPSAVRTTNHSSPVPRLKKTTVTVRNSVRKVAASVKCASAADNKMAGSLYEMLRVERTASFKDAMGSPSDGRDFIEIREAYAKLSDPTARATYDMTFVGTLSRRVNTRVYPTRRWETDQCW